MMAKRSRGLRARQRKKRAGAVKRRLKKPLPRRVGLTRTQRIKVMPRMAPLMRVAPMRVAQLMEMPATAVLRRAARVMAQLLIRRAAAQWKMLPSRRMLRIAPSLRAPRTAQR
jgi:hypothetical protein